MRVLLVEDAPRLAQAVAEILRGECYLVDVASTRMQAETLTATGAYDMILLDIMLPDGSGIDVLRGLRAAGDATPVILLTARDAVADRVAGLDAGADDYLPKPFHASELLSRIRALLRRPRFLMMDEPFASLDAMTRGDLQIMLKDLVDEQGMACLFVTHDMDEAFVVARRVVVMRGGRAAATFEAEEFSGWERRERVRDHILTCLGRKQGA